MLLNFNSLSTLVGLLHFIPVARGVEGNEAGTVRSSISAVEHSDPRFRPSASTSSHKRQNFGPQEEVLGRMKIMKKSWEENKDQLTLREIDTKELAALRKNLKERLDELRQEQEERAKLRSLEGLDESRGEQEEHAKLRSLSEAIDGLENLFETLNQLNQRNILELGGNDHLPNSNAELVNLAGSGNSAREKSYGFPDEINTFIAEKAWPHLGLAILTRLEELIINHQLFPTSSLQIRGRRQSPFQSTVMLWWKCIFKYIDFLSKHEQLDQDAIRNLGSDSLRQIVQYTKYRFEYDIGETLDMGTPYLTRHWYWPLLQDSFKALSQHQEKFINAYVLLDLRHQKILDRLIESNSAYLGYPHCKALYESFDVQWYLKLVWEKNNLAVSLSPKNEDIIIQDIKRMVNVITDPDRYNVPFYALMGFFQNHIYSMLDFIEQEVFPGVIERVKNHPKFDKFIVNFEFHRLYINITHLMISVQNYRYHIKKRMQPRISPAIYKSQIEIWNKELMNISQEFNGKMQTWSQGQCELIRNFNNEVSDFNRKLEEIGRNLQAPNIIN